MSTRYRFFHSLAFTVAIALWAYPAYAQTTAVGPYYATPSWDQSLAGNVRFVVLANFNSEAVLDRETGLVWERSPSSASLDILLPPGQFGGATAWERCIGLIIAGRMGWRVPSIQELTSLIDRSQRDPALPAGHPFLNVQLGPFVLYWSATEYRSSFTSTGSFRVVGFSNTGGTGVNGANHVWCVRGGAGTPTQ
jgi:hypothetical protein